MLRDAQNVGIEIFRPHGKGIERLCFQFDGENNVFREFLRECFDKYDKLLFRERVELMAACAGYNIVPLKKSQFPKDIKVTWAYKVTR